MKTDIFSFFKSISQECKSSIEFLYDCNIYESIVDGKMNIDSQDALNSIFLLGNMLNYARTININFITNPENVYTKNTILTLNLPKKDEIHTSLNYDINVFYINDADFFIVMKLHNVFRLRSVDIIYGASGVVGLVITDIKGFKTEITDLENIDIFKEILEYGVSPYIDIDDSLGKLLGLGEK